MRNDTVSKVGRRFDYAGWAFAATGCLIGLIYGLVGAWLVTAGPTDPVVHTANFITFLVSPWILATYVVAGSLIVFSIWYLRTAPRRSSGAQGVEVNMRRQAIWLSLCWVATAISLSAIGWRYASDLEKVAQQERSAQQKSIARLKAQQVDKWLLEGSTDAMQLATSLKALPLEDLPGAPYVRQAVDLLLADFLARNPERTAISLLAPDGNVLAHAGEGAGPDTEAARRARAAATSPNPKLSILDFNPDGATPPHLRMTWVVPVPAQKAGSPTAAVLEISIDPVQGFFRQFDDWSTPNETSVLVIVRQEGNDIVYVMPPPRLDPKLAPLAYRVPMTDSNMPAAQALRHGDGIYRGPDYRGVEALAASQHTIGLPWTIVAKTDIAEFMQPVRQKEVRLALVISATILLAGFMLAMVWRGQYVNLLAFRAQEREERTALGLHYEQLMRMARDIILLIRPDGLIIEANEAAAVAYGYSVEELRRLDIRDLQPPEELAHFEALWTAPEPAGGVLIEAVSRRRDGTTFPVEVSGRAIDIDGRIYRQSFIRDITQRKTLEHEVARLSNVKVALQAATSVLLRARSETELFQQMCEILVQQGGYRMVNVAIPNFDAARTVHYPAIAGIDNGYLARADISWGDGPRSKGPLGSAIQTGEVQVNQDTANNPTMAPWREEALKRGYHACIVLPLKLNGKVFAALSLYADVPNAFDKQETDLLVILADDLSYAVFRLRERT